MTYDEIALKQAIAEVEQGNHAHLHTVIAAARDTAEAWKRFKEIRLAAAEGKYGTHMQNEVRAAIDAQLNGEANGQ